MESGLQIGDSKKFPQQEGRWSYRLLDGGGVGLTKEDVVDRRSRDPLTSSILSLQHSFK
jgi:hypothetical protein